MNKQFNHSHCFQVSKSYNNAKVRKNIEGRDWNNWLNTVKLFYQVRSVSPLFAEVSNDNRPYVHIQLRDRTINALIDTGSNKNIIGGPLLNYLFSMSLPINYDHLINVTTADGKLQPVLGTVKLSFKLDNKPHEVECLIVPSVNHPIVLGINFCQKVGLSLDFDNNYYYCKSLISTLSSKTVSDVDSTTKIGLTPQQNLSLEQNRSLEKIIQNFKSLATDDLKYTPLIQHKIELTSSEPFRQRTFPLSPYMQSHMNREVDRLLKLNIIRPSKSPYNSNVILVKKPSGEYRLCFDGRKLNSITKPDSYPLPNLQQILDKLKNAKYLTSIDLKQAFFQIKLEDESCEKTAFRVIGKGLYEFCRMPFGLVSSAQTMQRLMDRLFDPSEIESNVFVYLDDLIIVNDSFSKHIETLNRVYHILKSANLTINIEKCKFCQSSLAFLGYIVDKDGLHTNPEKVSAIQNLPIPKTYSDVKRIVGMASWYRRFIQNFSDLVAPLNNLIKGRKKGQKIQWTEDAEKAFEELKNRLSTAPVLANPDFTKIFTLQVDASNIALGCVLTQGEGEEEKVIAYASRTLTKSEKNFTTTEKELLAVIFATNKFRSYIEGTRCKVITDHAALLWLLKIQNPSGRLARWAIQLSQYDMEVIHRKGKLNIIPDTLSRNIHLDIINENEETKTDKWYQNMIQRVTTHPEKFKDWHIADGKIYKFVNPLHNIYTNEKQWKLVPPKPNRLKIFQDYHDSPLAAHFGVNKTYNRILNEYYWPGLRKDVKKYISQCQICQEQKVSQLGKIGLMGNPKNINQPFQLISADIMGPFPKSKSGNIYLLNIVDWFTKYTFIFPLKKANSKIICKLIENNVFLTHGVPQIIVVDNGSQFVSQEFKSLLNKYKIDQTWYNARYHPQVNNVERANRVIGTAIRSYIKTSHREWDNHISEITSAINQSIHEVTGFSPNFLNFGRHIPISGDFYPKIKNRNLSPFEFSSRDVIVNELNKLPELYIEVAKKINDSYVRNKNYYDLRKRDIEFCTGDIVYKRNFVLSDAGKYFSAKLAPRYTKCRVKRKISKLIYELIDENGKSLGRFHIKDLKPSNPDTTSDIQSWPS